MAAVITILSIQQLTAIIDPPTPARQNVLIAATNDGGVTYYRMYRGDIAAGVDVPAYVITNAQAIYDDAFAGGISMTPGQVHAASYAWQHWINRDIFATAHYTYSIGMLSGAATLAAYRSVLQNALTDLAPLAGSQFDTEFTNERVALGVNITISTMTLVQCQTFATLLDRWLSARRVDVLWSKVIVGVA
jgi:hypothetical protein